MDLKKIGIKPLLVIFVNLIDPILIVDYYARCSQQNEPYLLSLEVFEVKANSGITKLKCGSSWILINYRKFWSGTGIPRQHFLLGLGVLPEWNRFREDFC